MEEQKKNMKIGAQKNSEMKSEQKLTYEQLNDACAQLYQQNQALARKLEQVNLTNMFKRLDYLFMVLQYAPVINDEKFINNCVAEIKESITIKDEDEKDVNRD